MLVPAAATSAMTSAQRPNRLNIDAGHLSEDEEAGHDHRGHGDERATQRTWLEEGSDVVGAHEVQDAGDGDRQKRQDVRGVALLSGEALDVERDAAPLADRRGDRLEDFGEASADLVVDVDRADDELEIVRRQAVAQTLEGVLLRRAEAYLTDDKPDRA